MPYLDCSCLKIVGDLLTILRHLAEDVLQIWLMHLVR
jgi:hypothetical protein